MKSCSVCSDPRREQIDAELRAGRSKLGIVRRYNVGRGAINGHTLNGHVRPGPEEPTDIEETLELAADDATPRERLETLIKGLEQQVKAAGKTPRTDLIRELRLAYGDLAKLEPPREAQTVDVTEVPELVEFFSEVFVALEPFPEARQALRPVLEKHGVLGS